MKSLIILILSFPFFSSGTAQKPTVGVFIWDELAKEGTDLAEIHFLQVGEPSNNLEVFFKVEGTATDGVDYRTFPRSVRFDHEEKFYIYPVQDSFEEGDETVIITLIENDRYTIEPGKESATIIIQDDELPDVEFSIPCSVNQESAEESVITLKLNKASDKTVRVYYSIQNILADSLDYQCKPGFLEFQPGQAEGSINLGVVDDNIPEYEETVIVRLTHADNANIGSTESHYYMIANDDGEMATTAFYDKVKGVVTGFLAGCSMGAITECNLTQERVEEVFGLLDTFLPYVHYGDKWAHPAGATEDGGERFKLMCTAIIEKQGRIDAADLAKIWIRDCEIEDMYHMTQPYDRILLNYVKWGIEGHDLPVTKYGTPYDLGGRIHLTARTFQAIPCINAGDPHNAIEDMKDLGRLYYEDPNDDAFAWGAVYNAAVALAMLPDATVESVIQGALEYATPEIKEELQFAFDITDRYDDPMNRDMWKELTDMYADTASPYYAFGRIEKYQLSSIYENVTYAMALFKATKGNVRQCVIIATNRGRDTDCTAASAGALAGAFSGTSTIPADWFTWLDKGIAENPYTNNHMSLKALTDGMYSALRF